MGSGLDSFQREMLTPANGKTSMIPRFGATLGRRVCWAGVDRTRERFPSAPAVG